MRRDTARAIILTEDEQSIYLLYRKKKENNKIITYYAIPGGMIEEDETVEEAVKREIKEELNKEIEITGYISTVENFFTMNGKKYHEILFIYKAEFKYEENKKLEEVLENKEGKDYLKYYWID